MLTEKFYEVLNHEGVVSIVSWGTEEAHVTCTWNSYLVVTDDERILIPAAGMHSTENDVNSNNKVKVTLGAREVMGHNNYQGTGFQVGGTANFLTTGPDFTMMKEKYPFLNRVLEITVTSAKQLL
ncbi:pyridoxamine 5'-phosphate oxidase family protein [Clostridium cellulovorans]|uniref:Pyridoxamine 5'-phosphate oxidase-related FMN-binding n=1 Tax=Clostridium cellulovorans (strain ATCC 35296 / DSM 3052 / OCM 3 / 743B) TaxID=573061 RepID=D9STX2_CLOC7|nr:pyridoxamine 5'-phosphate oxidase family protein [Clostridium cellulovorans]ADL50810.1 pyridoxamine 5'-phosphate oxidase-related FMN-binding [Clostridium cellulovorans 743B]